MRNAQRATINAATIIGLEFVGSNTAFARSISVLPHAGHVVALVGVWRPVREGLGPEQCASARSV
eukprot:4895597-Lingulodinium_polyedra.AAC.1